MSGARNASRNASSVNSRRQTGSTFPSAIPNNKSAPNSGGNARTRSANATNSFGRSAPTNTKPNATSHPKQTEARSAIHHDTILLLFCMMILIANLHSPSKAIERRAHHSTRLLTLLRTWWLTL